VGVIGNDFLLNYFGELSLLSCLTQVYILQILGIQCITKRNSVSRQNRIMYFYAIFQSFACLSKNRTELVSKMPCDFSYLSIPSIDRSFIIINCDDRLRIAQELATAKPRTNENSFCSQELNSEVDCSQDTRVANRRCWACTTL